MPSDKSIVHVIDDDEAVRQALASGRPASTCGHTNPPPSSWRLRPRSGLRHHRCENVRAQRHRPLATITRAQARRAGHRYHGALGYPAPVEAMRLGAMDFLEKPFEDEAVLASVRSALDKGDRDQKRQAERSNIEARLAALSNRERDVLKGLVAGRANKQIAYDLGISARTIENYRANLMMKTQAASLSDLVRMALIAGILSSADTSNAS